MPLHTGETYSGTIQGDTPMGRLQGEGYHSPCRQIQADSLIFEDLQGTPQSRTSDPIPVVAHDSCGTGFLLMFMMPPRTTDLPENVVKAILMCLPLQDAVRTSILSKKWRYNWCRLPQLTLDDKLWKTTDNFPSPSIKFGCIMYNILTLHFGPVTKFTLSMSELKKYPQIGSLIYFLSRNGIEHLVLQFSEWNRYKLPPSFFTCLQLRHLTLQNCLICPPPAFKGFDTVNHIQIKAPNLRSFDFSGCIKLISLNNVPLLAKLSLLYGESFEESEKCDLDKCFQSHHALEHLRLEYGSVKLSFLVAEVPRRLSVSLNHLKRLCVSLDGLDDLSCALCLLRSSPYLQDLEVKVINEVYISLFLVQLVK
uniref:F-box/FBD/LRR-repeat protein At1g13570-like n=1 Tax=Nicotiana sylvestris TaxID=4096 RepID=A0A1U7X6N2_NICSY|nr:PREDICTED: F-box/FBD/LRR-repeat protein At1g13570-like [Nicotiana sylvestris]